VLVPLSTRAQSASQSPVSLPRSIELTVIQTRNPTSEQFLVGQSGGAENAIAGELRIPAANASKYPAVVLMHGGGAGFNAAEDVWTHQLNQAGIATFTLDSGTGRRASGGFSGLTQLITSRLLDAYRALKFLAGDSRIDAKKIFVMGSSTGGHAALFSSSRRFTDLYGDGLQFAGHIGLYAVCNFRLIDDAITTGAPMILFHGSADDAQDIGLCRQYETDLKKAGVDVSFVEFPATQHGYDNPLYPANLFLPTGLSSKACSMRETQPGQLVSMETGKPFTFNDPCRPPGLHLGYNADAASETHRRVVDFIKLHSK
jgi:dienelactone hydrolase